MDPFALRRQPLVIGIPFLHFMGNKFTKMLFEHENVEKLLKRKEKFDVCFLETFHANAISVSTIAGASCSLYTRVTLLG